MNRCTGSNGPSCFSGEQCSMRENLIESLWHRVNKECNSAVRYMIIQLAKKCHVKESQAFHVVLKQSPLGDTMLGPWCRTPFCKREKARKKERRWEQERDRERERKRHGVIVYTDRLYSQSCHGYSDSNSTCRVWTSGHKEHLMLLNTSVCTKLTLFPHLDKRCRLACCFFWATGGRGTKWA